LSYDTKIPPSSGRRYDFSVKVVGSAVWYPVGLVSDSEKDDVFTWRAGSVLDESETGGQSYLGDGDYVFRVCDKINYCGESGIFRLATSAPPVSSMNITSPVSGPYEAGGKYNLKWSDAANGSKYNLFLRPVGGGGQYVIGWGISPTIDSSGAVRSYIWEIGSLHSGTLPLPGDYYFTVCHDHGAKCAYSGNFKIENPPPVVAHPYDTGKDVLVIDPNGGESLVPGTTYTIKWAAKDGGEKYDLAMLKSGTPTAGAFPGEGYGLSPTTSNGEVKTYAWTVPAVSGTDFTVRVCPTGVSNCDQSNSFFTVRRVERGSLDRRSWLGSIVEEIFGKLNK